MMVRLFSLAGLLFLVGCTLAPGMKMYDARYADRAWSDGPGLEVPGAMLREITHSFIQEQRMQQRGEVADAHQEKELYEYRIGAGDILTITVWDHPELTIPAGQFRSPEATGDLVAEDGTLFYPYVGLIQAAGKTIRELRQLLAERLSRYIEDVQLDVRVAAYRSQRAYVVGEVNQPGIQSVTDIPLTVAEAINRSGGVTREADLVSATLSRGDKVVNIDLAALYEKGDLTQNLLLKHGDVLNVPDRGQGKVFVLGEVLEPSSRVMTKSRMTLTEALSDAGGVDPNTSNPARIYVIRGDHLAPEIFHLNAKSPDALLLANQFELMPRDVVYVDTAGVTRWNRVISQILPTVQLTR